MAGTRIGPAHTRDGTAAPRVLAPPGTPDARGPWRYLWWLIASQPRRVLTGSFWGTAWMVGLMVPPYLVARAVDDGLDSAVEAQGRNLSGGQRQRVRLARAVLAEPEVLLLVEPTSSVDAHTEAAVAARLHEARRGRTTVVVGTSPLLLDRADQVVFLVGCRVAAVGTHGELLNARPNYRALVFRGTDEDGEGGS